MQARDSNRISDLSITNDAVGIFAAQGGTSLGSSNVVYISVPDPVATSSQGDQCQGLGLPTPPSGTTYFCGASSSYRNTNGTGWIPVNFSSLAGGSPLGQLPQDPVNTTSTGLYYTYATNGSQYVITAIPEAQKTKLSYGTVYSVPDYPNVLAEGTSYTISPLWNSSGLMGYWPFEESGSSTADASGNGSGGSWNGNPGGNNSTYYTGGKVGNYAGYFNNNAFVNLGNPADLQVSRPSDTACAGLRIEEPWPPDRLRFTDLSGLGFRRGFFDQPRPGHGHFAGEAGLERIADLGKFLLPDSSERGGGKRCGRRSRFQETLLILFPSIGSQGDDAGVIHFRVRTQLTRQFQPAPARQLNIH